MNRSLKAFEAERERVVCRHAMALELSTTPLQVALSCSRETTLVERAIEARLDYLRAEGDRFMAEAAELYVAGVPSHEIVWRSSLGAAAYRLGCEEQPTG